MIIFIRKDTIETIYETVFYKNYNSCFRFILIIYQLIITIFYFNRLKDYKNSKLFPLHRTTTSVPADSTSTHLSGHKKNFVDQNGGDTETESVHSANQGKL